MAKFEYKIVKNVPEKDLESILNVWGQDGWECFEMEKDYEPKGKATYTIYLKRSVEKDRKFIPIKEHVDKYVDPDWEETFKKYTELTKTGSTNHCLDCPNNPKNRPVTDRIGDSPCQWCQHNPWKITVSTSSLDEDWSDK